MNFTARSAESLESLNIAMCALEASQCGITITNANLPDNPIIYANKAFIEMTGYSLSEVLNRNCRFLQGEDRNQAGTETLRQSIKNATGCRVQLRNYKKDGTLFWNELVVSPVSDEQGLRYFVGVQNDITELTKVKQQRDDFVSTLIHDLKNPIIGANRVLENDLQWLLASRSTIGTAKKNFAKQPLHASDDF